MIQFLSGPNVIEDNVLESLFPNLPNFIAHILATIVIILFLAKLVYKPFRETIKARRKKINALLDEASTKQAIANKNNKEANKFLDNAKIESREIINNAKKQADNLKIEIIENAKKEANNIQIHAKKTIEFEKNEAHEEIRKQIIDLAFEAAEKIVEKNVSKDMNQKIINDFLNYLDND